MKKILLFILVIMWFDLNVLAQVIDEEFPVCKSNTKKIIIENENMYLFSSINDYGKYTGGFVLLDANNWEKKLDLNNLHIRGISYKCISDGKGGFLLAGNFYLKKNNIYTNLIHINNKLEYDNNFISGVYGDIIELVLDNDGNIYLTGYEFEPKTLSDTIINKYICKLNSEGKIDNSFKLPALLNENKNKNFFFNSIFFDNSGNLNLCRNVYIKANQYFIELIKFNNKDNKIESFFSENFEGKPSIVEFDINGNIFCLGDFTKVGNYNIKNLAKLSSNNLLLDTNFNININNEIVNFAIDGKDIYISGTFTNINGYNKKLLAKVNIETSKVDDNFNLILDSNSKSLKILAINKNSDLFLIEELAVQGISKLKLNQVNTKGVSKFSKTIFYHDIKAAFVDDFNNLVFCGDFGVFDGKSGGGLKINAITGVIDEKFNQDYYYYNSNNIISDSKYFYVYNFNRINLNDNINKNIAKFDKTNGKILEDMKIDSTLEIYSAYSDDKDNVYLCYKIYHKDKSVNYYTSKLDPNKMYMDTVSLKIPFAAKSFLQKDNFIYISGLFYNKNNSKSAILRLNINDNKIDTLFYNNDEKYEIEKLTIINTDLYYLSNFKDTFSFYYDFKLEKINLINKEIQSQTIFFHNYKEYLNEVISVGDDIYFHYTFPVTIDNKEYNILKFNTKKNTIDTSFGCYELYGCQAELIYSIAHSKKDNSLFVGGCFNNINLNIYSSFFKIKLDVNTDFEEEINTEKNLYSFISPNPASDYIEINVGAGSKPALENPGIEIYNIFGEKNPTLALPTGEGTRKIDISNLAPGVYFIKIGDKFEKFVKL